MLISQWSICCWYVRKLSNRTEIPFAHIFFHLQGRRLLIFGTTGLKDVLTEMGMLNAFMANQHVSVLTKPDHVMLALQELEIFNTNDLEKIRDKIFDRRFVCYFFFHLLVLKCLYFTVAASFKSFVSLKSFVIVNKKIVHGFSRR